MTHYMKLNQKPFDLMSKGLKTIELRLNDEKRQNIKCGDIIIFSSILKEEEKITVRVVKIHKFKSFEELYACLPLEKCGYSSEELKNASPKDMLEYYPLEKQQSHGVLGIEITRV